MQAARLPPAARVVGAFGVVILALAFLSVVVPGALAATPVGVDPNAIGRGSADAVAIVRWLSPGVYQLDVQNTSGIGYIDQFTWVPPAALTVTGISRTEGGKCAIVSSNIQCNGKVSPPQCTCSAGGDLVVTFTATGLDPTFANGYWTYHGMNGAYLQIQQMTPVPYHIPSTQPTTSVDLPLCKKGHKSTQAHPCATV